MSEKENKKPVPVVDTIRKVVRQARKRKVMGEEHPMLKMDPHSFDQGDSGWRSLPRSQQANVVKSYVGKYVGPGGKFTKDTPGGGKNINSSTIRWHLGQVQAMAGKKGDAIRNMERSKENNNPQWNRYVGATTSFLKGDKARFEKNAKASDRYAATSGERGQDRTNRKIMTGLKKGWGKDYKNAY